MPEFCQGRVIWAVIVDPKGNNPKHRPAVIISSTADATEKDGFIVVVCSTRPAAYNPLPPEFFEIPSAPAGHPHTLLKEPTFACCKWVSLVLKCNVSPDDIGGVVPVEPLAHLLHKLHEIHEKPLEDAKQSEG